jgi:hypothetical protein
MATEQIVTLLILERDRLNRAIEALCAPVKRLGRPRKAAKPTVAAVPAVAPAAPIKKRKPMTAAQKKALSKKMKAAWAKRKKQTSA